MSDHVLPQFVKKTTKIAYYDPFNVYGELKNDLISKLPLVNLHWHPASRPLRSIPTLDVDLVEETTSADTAPKHQMLGLSNAPYLKIIFVKCEDNDTYRSLVRKMIREWLTKNVVSLRDPTEWLIFHYVPVGSKSYSGSRFRSGVFDKIRADFNSGSKKDRCIQIRAEFKNEIEDMEVWSEAVTKLKEGVLAAFSRRVELYQEEIVKLEAKKTVLGWNFGTYFVMKEGLALSFDAISLYEDALIIYDELEELFSKMSRQRTVTFFTSIGFDEPESVSASILDINETSNLRYKIMSNEITLFDFYCYLFAQQARLLLYISKSSSSPSIAALKIGELFLRLRTFLSEVSGMLKSNKKDSLKIAEWVYNVAMEFYNATISLKEGLAREVSEGRGEMSLLCRKSLEEGAARKGWLIEGALAEVSLDDDGGDSSYEIQSTKLQDLLKDETSFHNEYRRLTSQAIKDFNVADRVRIVNRLSSQLALLEFQSKKFEVAAELLESIPSLYNRQGWEFISTSLALVYIQCLEELKREADLFTYSLHLLCNSKHLTSAEVKYMVANVHRLSSKGEKKVAVDELFDIDIIPYIYSKGPGVFALKMKIKSGFAEDIELHEGILTLKNVEVKEKEKFKLNCQGFVVKGNVVTECEFITDDFREGIFEISSLQLRQNKLSLFKTFNSDEEVYVQFYKSIDQIWGELKQPLEFKLSDNIVHFYLHFPFDLRGCTVSLKSENDVKLLVSKTTIEGVDLSIVSGSGLIKINGAKKNTPAILKIPFSSGYEKRNIAVKCSVDYTIEEQRHRVFFSDSLNISLLIDATEHDYFKMMTMFARFCIGSRDKNDPVTIEKVALSAPDGYKVSSPIGNDSPAIAFHGSPLNYVFSIQKLSSDVSKDPLLLIIHNRNTKSECLARLYHLMESLMDDKVLRKYLLLIRPVLRSLPLDLVKYSLDGEIEIGSGDITTAIEESGILSFVPEVESKLLLHKIHALDWKKLGHDINMQDITYKLTIPVTLSHVEVVHSVELKLPEKSHYVIAEAVVAKLLISSTRHWSLENEPVKQHSYYYDIHFPQDTWAISGKRMAKFTLEEGKVTTTQDDIEVILIPLREGKLVYPRINVIRPVDTNSKAEMVVDYKSASEAVLVVPERDRVTLTF